jgi:hypothetical protein
VPISSTLEVSVGAVVMAAALVDVFLTVLYARAGTGIVSPFVTRGVWRMFRVVARAFGRRGGLVLSLCGPAVVVSLILFWAFQLTLGAALIYHPFLGSAVTSDNGPTPRDFVTALFVAASSMSIVGSSGFSPHTSGLRFLFLWNSLVGMSVISVTLSYLVQIYTALQRRNVVGLRLHLYSGKTGDAVEVVPRIAPGGSGDSAASALSELGSDIADLKETHHFYPVLAYFRFPDRFYSVSYITRMSLDCASLIRSALDPGRYGSLQESGAMAEIWDGALMLLDTVQQALGVAGGGGMSKSGAKEWRGRYYDAVRRFQQAGIATPPDLEPGAERYAQLRAQWDERVRWMGSQMLYTPEEVDPASKYRTKGERE